LQGARGMGKRCAAAWIAGSRLGTLQPDATPAYPLVIPEHADLHWMVPLEGKQSIGVDQIRELVDSLSLTSYEGGSKVAIIDPAQAMTVNAANSLLKTLEEPPGDALLILIADRIGKLPATILSRCQRIHLPPPPEDLSLAWLNTLQTSDAWPYALRLGGNAPLAAVTAHERIADSDALAKDFAALPDGRAMPLEVAARWAKMEPEFVLDWLSRQLELCIMRVFGGISAVPPGGIKDSVLQRIDRRNLFCYLDGINRLRGQPGGSYNVQLTFESLLIDWALGIPQREL